MNRSPPEVPGYQLHDQLGEGAFGSVWRATDLERSVVVAIKILKAASADTERRFERELLALRRLDHPNCVRPIASGVTANGRPFLTTELILGQTLDDWLNTSPGIDAKLHVAEQILLVLIAAHREGVVHRDLKPSNVMIAAGDAVRVVDFGIAKLAGREQPDITKTGEVLGTPGYMSPEQLRGERSVGPAADMYAFGSLLFVMLERRAMFAGDSAIEVAMKHLIEPAPAMRAPVPAPIRALVAQLTSKDPSHRPTARAALNVLRGDQQLQLEDTPWNPRHFALVAVLLVVVALIALVVVTDNETPPVPPPLDTKRPLPFNDPVSTSEPDPSPPVAPNPSCGDLPPRPGDYPLGERALVRIPPTYDGEARFPLLVLFADGGLVQGEALRMMRPEQSKLADNFVVLELIAPDTQDLSTAWNHLEHYEDAEAVISQARSTACVNDETHLLGFGRGGAAAVQTACRLSVVTSLATYAYRWAPRDATCEPGTSFPILTISSAHDPLRPIEGGRNCRRGRALSVADHDTEMLALTGCRGRSREQSQTGGTCRKFDCEPAAETCLIDGGRTFRGGGPEPQGRRTLRKWFSKCKEPVAPQFPAVDYLFEFAEASRSDDPVDLGSE